MNTNTNTTNTMKAHPILSMRRAAVSLTAFETTDPAMTIGGCKRAMTNSGSVQPQLIWDKSPAILWDICRGFVGLNKAGERAAADMAPDGALQSANPAEAIALLGKAPEYTIAFISNAHRIVGNETVAQAIWNLRDAWKQIGATLVLMAPAISLPAELREDVVVVTEPLPTRAEIEGIVTSILSDAKMPVPTDGELDRVVDTLTGLSGYSAEQTLSMSITKSGIDTDALWERKVKAIESTSGLTVHRGNETLGDYAGAEYAKEVFGNMLKGELRYTCLVFIDEVDKGMAAAGSDSSGTTQDQSKALLSYTQDNDILGATALGPPGTGKTFLMKCLAGHFRIPLIMLDLGAMKDKLVGQSEQNMRAALKVIHAISDGRALFVIACNRDQGLPPEFRRRFSFQTFFFDLPSKAERVNAWKLYCSSLKFQGRSFQLKPEQCDYVKVNDEGWTPSEIRNCCLKALAMGVTLSEAAKSIVPISKSAAEQVDACRRNASGRYTSIMKAEPYQYVEDDKPAKPAAIIGGSRRIAGNN
jgi:AAA+ superfamily predicted ATPase